jgi:hypothetical protein
MSAITQIPNLQEFRMLLPNIQGTLIACSNSQILLAIA